MSEATIQSRVAEAINEVACVDLERIIPEARLADLGLDSLDAVEVTMEIEDEFGLEITDADADKFEKVQDIIDYVSARKTL